VVKKVGTKALSAQESICISCFVKV